MTTLFRYGTLASLVALSACSAFEPQEPPDAFQRRIATLQDIGRISTSLSHGTEVAGTATEALNDPELLQFESVTSGKICFTKRITFSGVQTDGITSIDVEDTRPDYLLKRLRSTPYVVEAFASLKAVPPRPTFSENATRLDEITPVDTRLVTEEGSRLRVRSDGTIGHTTLTARQWTFRMCGRAPAITADTHYVTVVHHVADAPDDMTVMYAWAISDDENTPQEVR